MLAVCKTLIHRFDSDPHLQNKRTIFPFCTKPNNPNGFGSFRAPLNTVTLA